ncbi:MAG: polysaccharide deacetylase family protein [Vicinamibacterales bacterium]
MPFLERGGRLRGILDLATCRYPSFLFGGSIGALLPVFHLHDESRESLEAQFAHLAEHGYRTVTSDAIARFVREGRHPGSRTVALCFDDAWATVWTVALPLLRRYGFQAITFAIPGRIEEADRCRPTIDDRAEGAPPVTSESPLVTWPELEALHGSGFVDVQSHAYSHASVFCQSEPLGFVTPDFATRDLLARPQVSTDDPLVFLTPADLGAPLFPQRSRLSDAVRYLDDPEVRRRLMAFVRDRGGAVFFDRPSWQAELRAQLGEPRGLPESPEARRRAIRDDLDRARSVLNARLRTNTIRHLCFPWGVAGTTARAIARAVGYETAFSDRLFGFRAVRFGDDPYCLMRLNGKYITKLPRVPRRSVTAGRS